MVQTWSSGEEADVTCLKCGSVYSVTTYRLPVRDSDSFSCEVCNHLLRRWNERLVPNFTLKKAGEKPSEKGS